jgi:hypothetical protein
MIKPDEFYGEGDSLRESRRNAMWATIRRHATTTSSGSLVVWDRRSFVFGMAASLIVALALYGGWSIVRQAFETATPQPLRLERAYISAIREFERVVPSIPVSDSKEPQLAGQLLQRREQLKLVDAAISDLRSQTNRTDLSPLKRERLRQLYSMKLKILQQMIEEGEMEL